MKKLFRNGSGLLELILVGLIIVILFIIVVPVILENINTSKKNSYIDIVKMYVEAARMAVITEKIEIPSDLNQATFIHFDQLKPFLENGGSSSSYGNEWDMEHSFIVVVNEGAANYSTKYAYYVAAWDGKHALGDAIDGKGEARIILESDLTAENVVSTTEGAIVSSDNKYTRKVSVSGVTYLTLDSKGSIQMFAFEE